MSTSEKKEPESDAKPEEKDPLLNRSPCIIFAMCCAVLGYTRKLTHIDSSDGFLKASSSFSRVSAQQSSSKP